MPVQDESRTDKIGLVAYMCMKGHKVIEVAVKNKNRASFKMPVSTIQLLQIEQEYMQSDFFKFFEQFRWLREQVIKSDTL
jgi:hypothetical protein